MRSTTRRYVPFSPVPSGGRPFCWGSTSPTSSRRAAGAGPPWVLVYFLVVPIGDISGSRSPHSVQIWECCHRPRSLWGRLRCGRRLKRPLIVGLVFGRLGVDSLAHPRLSERLSVAYYLQAWSRTPVPRLDDYVLLQAFQDQPSVWGQSDISFSHHCRIPLAGRTGCRETRVRA